MSLLRKQAIFARWNQGFTASLGCFVVATLATVLVSGCAQGAPGVQQPPTPDAGWEPPGGPQFPATLPVDALQPWERLDETGFAVELANQGRSTSLVNSNSLFTAGVEAHLAAGDTAPTGEALSLASGSAGSKELSYAIYRIPLAGEQLGVLTTDVNITPMDDGKLSSYYVGLADYGNNRWKWYGPVSDSSFRLSTAQAEEPTSFISGLGNAFVCIAAYGGSAVNVVGIGADSLDPADTTAPPQPPAPVLTSAAGGILVDWLPVVADDVAGYKVYYADFAFSGLTAFAANQLQGLQSRQTILELAGEESTNWFVGLTAVDISGNESELSSVVPAKAEPAGDEPFELWVDLDQPSALVGETVTMGVDGAASYDWDLDGDGVFDVTSDTTGTQQVDTNASGLIRPLVRGRDGNGLVFSQSAVSVIIGSNSRPVAFATAVPQSGAAPLTVDFTGSGTDFDGLIVGGGWDFDGDGIFDVWDDTDIVHVLAAQHTYTEGGLYNAKLQVIDDEGSWDVDTVAIQAIGAGSNQEPVITAITANPGLIIPGGSVDFNVVATDSDGTVAGYSWDFDNDGTPDSVDQTTNNVFSSAGTFNVAVTVMDDDGATATGHVTVNVVSDPINLPPVITEFIATPNFGPTGVVIEFAFAGTDPDGTVTNYALDYENNGNFDFNTGTAGTNTEAYNTAGYYTCCLKVTDNAGAETRSYIGLQITDEPTNIPPVAILAANFTKVPISSNNSQGITFDVTDSYDPEGGTLTLELDHDGNGTYSAIFTTSSKTYTASGIYQARLKVTDDAGNTTYDSLLIQVYRMDSVTVDSTNSVGTFADINSNNGQAGVAYYDTTNTQLMYVTSNGPGTTSWDPPQVLDTFLSVGQYCSLNVIHGTSFYGIAYYDATQGDLRFISTPNRFGRGGWGTPEAVDSAVAVGSHCSLAKVADRAAISYYDMTNTSLKYVRAIGTLGSTWNAALTIDNSASVGTYSSLEIVDGNPAIAYYDATNTALKYIRANDSTGTTWGTGITVFATNDVGIDAQLVVAAGNPAIGFWDDTDERVLFVRATDTTGSAWGSPVVVADNEGVMDGQVSCAIVHGRPAMTWTTNQALRLGVANNLEGSSWNNRYVDYGGSPYDVGEQSNITDINGFPAIAHFSNQNDALKVAVGRVH